MTDWDKLKEELDRWPEGKATFWWRDDDATAPSPALSRLIALGLQPLAIAAIPARVESALAEALNETRIDVLQHGYGHVNHEADGAKKAELGAARPAEAVIEELSDGRRRMEALFGPRFLPVMVPPWNRIADAVVARLPEAGFRGLSTYRARPRDSSASPTGRISLPCAPPAMRTPIACGLLAWQPTSTRSTKRHSMGNHSHAAIHTSRCARIATGRIASSAAPIRRARCSPATFPPPAGVVMRTAS